MTVSIRRMSLGAGYRYLMESVAVGDGRVGASSPLTRYYTESGTPPGYFLGRGLVDLDEGRGVELGSQVSEEHLFNLLGMCADPVSGKALGRQPMREPKPLSPRVASRLAALGELSEVERAAAATVIEAEEREKDRRVARPVAGFDLTLSLPKGASIAFALGDEETRQAIYDAHHEAIAIVLSYAEDHVFSSRSGRGGIVEEDITGVIAAAFDHFDSRAGDPHLHTHLVIANRAKSISDDAWRTLDSRRIFASVVALSELHEGVVEDLLAARLGVSFEAHARRHSAVPRFELAGISNELLAEFSTRSAAIEAETQRLVEQWRVSHGREPTSAQVLRLRQQATLSTRGEKQHLSLEQLTASWRERARALVGEDPERFVAVLSDHLPVLVAVLDRVSLEALARAALGAVAERRATFSAANIRAEVHRLLHGRIFSEPEARIEAAERAVELALGAAVSLSASDHLHVPALLTRPDGSSRLSSSALRRYTTAELLEAERRLVEAGRDHSAVRVAPVISDAVLGAGRQLLGVDQLLAVEQIVSSGRSLDVLVGPAGSGKTTTLQGLRAVWEAVHGAGSVVGLAPSAAAAEVLAEGLQIATENTAKWLVEHRRQAERVELLGRLRAELASSRAAGALSTALTERIAELEGELARWSLRAGQLLMIDEASLASTRDLDEIVAAARPAGAKVLLVGDPHQLSSVAAGGAFSMLVADRADAPELSEVRRFSESWEAEASLQLRRGDEGAIGAYLARGRVHDGDRKEMLEALFAAWRADVQAGRRTVMIAADNDSVEVLNARARAARVAAGEVCAEGARIAGDGVAGVGDLVVTRENDRRLVAGRGWVRNGNEWVVTAANPDGSLRVRRRESMGSTTLPADYVRHHVELAYASTTYRVQGSTVEVARALVNSAMTLEALYVAATRGRAANHLYVEVSDEPDPDTAHGEPQRQLAVEVLRRVLDNAGADVAASVAMAGERDRQASIATLAAEYQVIAQLAQEARWQRLLGSCGLPGLVVEEIRRSAAYGALSTTLREAEARGVDLAESLPMLVAARSLEGADDLAAALHGRVRRFADASGRRRRHSGSFIAGLVPAACGVDDADLAHALEERATAMERRADALVARALEQKERWLTALGQLPKEHGARARWVVAARTLAAYRDRWSITGDRPLGAFAPTGEEQSRQLTRVTDVLGRARAGGQQTVQLSGSGDLGIEVGSLGDVIGL
ncbi:MAG TPA: MobF family relaxase [Acidimicrobiales bacterium]|nr:MobF family relaxase [Acidimicrobiales bacterium]